MTNPLGEAACGSKSEGGMLRCTRLIGHLGMCESRYNGSKWSRRPVKLTHPLLSPYSHQPSVPDPDEDHFVAKSIAAQEPWGFEQKPIVEIFKPHEFQGLPGAIGGSCTVCGSPISDSIHHVISIKPPRTPQQILQSPQVHSEMSGERHCDVEFLNLPTEDSVRIVKELLPEIMERFLTKHADYQDFELADLGAKAHFVGVWRKVGKLKRALWDEKELEHEQVPELIDDVIGHLLLARLGLTGPKA